MGLSMQPFEVGLLRGAAGARLAPVFRTPMEKELFAMSIEVYEIVMPIGVLCWAIGMTLYTCWEGNRLERKHSKKPRASGVCPCCGHAV